MNPSVGLISNIQRYSIHDGPGIRTTVFFKGCPLRCLWCDNPENLLGKLEMMIFEDKCLMCGRCIKTCPLGAIIEPKKIDKAICNGCGKCAEACPSGALVLVGKYMTVEEVIQEIEKDRIFYNRSGGGVTLSGGEPLYQWAFARDLLKKCKATNIPTAVETSGFTDWDSLESVLKYVDLFLYDIKLMDRYKHIKYVGVPNDSILANAYKLRQSEAKMIIRVPLIPRHNATKENIAKTAHFAKEIDVDEIHLLPFHQFGKSKYARLGLTYALRELHPPSDQLIKELAEVVKMYGRRVKIGG